jgi:predicted DNA binding CopG/RHH family protein
MGKVSQFLWRLFRKATESDEQKEEPTKVTMRRLSKKAYHKTTIRLPAGLVRAYKHAALERNTTYSYLIEEALDYYLKEVLRRKRRD